MSDLNPFPDYAVVRLKTKASIVHDATILTPAIVTARALVDRYASQWLGRQTDKTQQIESIITAVRGDYGTGKTHLLLDSAAHLKAALEGPYPDSKVIRVACLETDPFTWFRLNIGPEFKPPVTSTQIGTKAGFLERLMLRFYAAAGRTVASRTKLTEGAVEKLANEPEAIRTLVKDNLLNISAVDEEFSLLLQKECPEANQNVRRALAATVWIDSAPLALRWLAGESLSEDDRNLLRVSKDLSDEEDASGVILALAAVHRYLDTPFVIMFDELEHLTRYDQSQQSKRNITWLKRLLEGLAAHQALTFVSGHWSAWEAQNDYLDRFSQLRPIELVKLTSDDVLMIVRQRVPGLSALSPSPFAKPQAEAVLQSTDGNIRRVLTLCRVLFKESNGFIAALTPEQIQTAAVELGQRISPDDAVLRVRGLMEHEGLTVRTQSATAAGIAFDLIGYQGNQIRVVVDIKHAVHQADQHDQAKVFLDRVEEVHKTAPEVIGCFLADGNVDDDLLALLSATRPFKLLWYDLTKADAMTRVAADLRTSLEGGVAVSPPLDTGAAQLSARKVENEELIAQLEDRIKVASADANAGLVTQLQEQRLGVQQQLVQLNEQLTQREVELRAEFLKSVRAQVEELDQKRSAELKDLYARLEDQQREAQSRRDEELLRKQEGEEVPKLSVTYAELTRPVPISKKLQVALSGPPLLVVLLCMVGGLALFFLSDIWSGTFGYYPGRVYILYKAVFYSVSLLVVLAGPLLVWLRMTKAERFFDYSSRTLREIYLRSRSVEDLVRADNILRDSLETYGLVGWKKRAESRLWDTFGPMIGAPPEIDR